MFFLQEKVLIHKTQLIFLRNQRIERLRRDNFNTIFLQNTGFCVLFDLISGAYPGGGIWEQISTSPKNSSIFYGFFDGKNSMQVLKATRGSG